MPRGESPLQSETPQGTLDMLVLRVLVVGPAHGHTIAHAIERGSEDVLQISMAPCTPPFTGWKSRLDRVVLGHVRQQPQGEYYRLTPTGRKQLAAQTTRWEEIVRASAGFQPSTE